MTLSTPLLPLESTGYRCDGGPLDGATVYLSEHSRETATMRVERYLLHDTPWHGRYVLNDGGTRLVWRDATCDLAFDQGGEFRAKWR